MSCQPSNRNQFVWVIDNFILHSQKPGTSFKSPVFVTTNLFQTEWRLFLKINGKKKKTNSISFHLKRCHSAADTAPKDLFLQMEMSLLDFSNKECFEHYVSCNFRKGRKRGFASFIDRKTIINLRDTLLREGRIVLQCCIWKCVAVDIEPKVSRISSSICIEQFNFNFITSFTQLELKVKQKLILLSDISWNGFDVFLTLEQENEEGQLVDVINSYIAPKSSNPKTILVVSKVHFLDGNGRFKFAFSDQKYFKVGETRPWRHGRIHRSTLTDPEMRISNRESFHLKYDITVADGEKAKCTRRRMDRVIDLLREDTKTLLVDVGRKFVDSSNFPDVYLKLGDELFPAHKLILSARSPVFDELLRNAERELDARRTLSSPGFASDRRRSSHLVSTDESVARNDVQSGSQHMSIDDSESDSDVVVKGNPKKIGKQRNPLGDPGSDSDVSEQTATNTKGKGHIVGKPDSDRICYAEDLSVSTCSWNCSQLENVRIKASDSDDVQAISTDNIQRTTPRLDLASLESREISPSEKCRMYVDSVSPLGADETNPKSNGAVLASNSDIQILVKDGKFIAEITGMSRHSLEQMMNCMYTDKLSPMDLEQSVTLYKVGVKYQFPWLMDQCELQLISSICNSTYTFLLKTAHSLQLPNLKQEVLDFVVRNSDFVLFSEEWRVFLNENKLLGADTLRYIRDKKTGPSECPGILNVESR